MGIPSIDLFMSVKQSSIEALTSKFFLIKNVWIRSVKNFQILTTIIPPVLLENTPGVTTIYLIQFIISQFQNRLLITS